MAQPNRETESRTGSGAKPGRAAESQRLLDNLLALRETSSALARKTEELKDLMAVLDLNVATARSIRVDLNRMAIRLGLKPIGARKTKS